MVLRVLRVVLRGYTRHYQVVQVVLRDNEVLRGNASATMRPYKVLRVVLGGNTVYFELYCE